MNFIEKPLQGRLRADRVDVSVMNAEKPKLVPPGLDWVGVLRRVVAFGLSSCSGLIVATSLAVGGACAAEVRDALVAACTSGDMELCRSAIEKSPVCGPADRVCDNERIGFAQLGDAYAQKKQACSADGLSSKCTNAKQRIDEVSNRLNESLNAFRMKGVFTGRGPDEEVFNWRDQEFKAGDCRSDTVSVTIRSDGTGHLKSTSFTYSTHSGDYWWWSIAGLDKDEVVIWTIPPHKGPRMDQVRGAGPRTHNDFDFTFDAAKYGATKYLGLGQRC